MSGRETLPSTAALDTAALDTARLSLRTCVDQLRRFPTVCRKLRRRFQTPQSAEGLEQLEQQQSNLRAQLADYFKGYPAVGLYVGADSLWLPLCSCQLVWSKFDPCVFVHYDRLLCCAGEDPSFFPAFFDYAVASLAPATAR